MATVMDRSGEGACPDHTKSPKQGTPPKPLSPGDLTNFPYHNPEASLLRERERERESAIISTCSEVRKLTVVVKGSHTVR